MAKNNNGWAPIYGMAFLGAVYYYISTAPSFWQGVLGVIKAIFWPAVLLVELMTRWGM